MTAQFATSPMPCVPAIAAHHHAALYDASVALARASECRIGPMMFHQLYRAAGALRLAEATDLADAAEQATAEWGVLHAIDTLRAAVAARMGETAA